MADPITIPSGGGGSKKLMYILVGSMAILVFLVLILIIKNIGGSTSTQKITLQFWSVFDDHNAYDRQIAEFEKVNPNVHVIFTALPYDGYQQEIIDKLAANQGPDVFLMHNTWLPSFANKLAPMPDKIAGQSAPLITLKDFQSNFVDVAYNDLVMNGKIYSLPLYVDSLALFYNKDLLNAAGITTPPKTYTEFNDDVEKLTKFDTQGNISQAGAAIGTSKNINRSTDILMAIMLQTGVRMTDDNHQEATFAKSVDNQRVGEIALQYYTDFSNPTKRTYAWNDSQHYSIDAFTEGNTAMMFSYSHEIPIIRGKNARLNFAVAPMPQPSLDNPRTFADYWSPAVTLKSPNTEMAWKFVAFLAQQDQATTYLNATNRPAALRSLIDLQKNDVDLGVFAQQALTARSWYQIDENAIGTIFADMIDDVNLGRASIRDAIANAQSKVTVLMSKR